MTDIVSREKRSEMMAGIRGRDTLPELLVRRALHARGLRFSLHRKELPGKPDIVLRKWRTVVFVHGCFWHSHGCKYSTMPKSNVDFWHTKLRTNVANDARHRVALEQLGWKVLYVWECELKGKSAQAIAAVIDRVERQIRENGPSPRRAPSKSRGRSTRS